VNIPKSLPEIGRTDTLSAGAQKALRNFRRTYGSKEGNRIFLAKADENGAGRTLRQKVDSIYKKGGHLHG
jgi:hypothetical protein